MLLVELVPSLHETEMSYGVQILSSSYDFSIYFSIGMLNLNHHPILDVTCHPFLDD